VLVKCGQDNLYNFFSSSSFFHGTRLCANLDSLQRLGALFLFFKNCLLVQGRCFDWDIFFRLGGDGAKEHSKGDLAQSPTPLPEDGWFHTLANWAEIENTLGFSLMPADS